MFGVSDLQFGSSRRHDLHHADGANVALRILIQPLDEVRAWPAFSLRCVVPTVAPLSRGPRDRGASAGQTDPAHQIGETRVGAQRIEAGPEKHTGVEPFFGPSL